MFDFIKSLFGKGKIRLKGTTTCGQLFTIKMDYIGDPDTFEPEEVRERVRQELLVQAGLKMKTCVLVGMTAE